MPPACTAWFAEKLNLTSKNFFKKLQDILNDLFISRDFFLEIIIVNVAMGELSKANCYFVSIIMNLNCTNFRGGRLEDRTRVAIFVDLRRWVFESFLNPGNQEVC